MDIQAKIAILELQQSRFEPSFSETEKFSALNDVVQLVRQIERELQQLDASGDWHTQARAVTLRGRFQMALQQLAAAGVSVPLPTGVTV
ncbi:hypothetical protein HRbin16_00246 [bacterium HR16]|nr:hypothetical protein HRbin16_00246 [bacterium HR16]